MTILEAAAALRTGKASSAELTSATLERIREMNPKLNAIQTVMEESARARARQADDELARGQARSPLHGIPIALKDLFVTKGVRTTGGSKLFENWVPDYDDAVVEKLDAAGAVVVGKAGMHELAYGITSNNIHFGAVRNPCNPECIPGGSSGGSASAVASGMVFMAMGSDTGGSIRIPASFCGTVGLQAHLRAHQQVRRHAARLQSGSHGAAGTHPCAMPRWCSNSSPVTIRATKARPAAPVTKIVPEAGCSIRGVRIGMPENFYLERLDADVEAAVRGAFRHAESLGAIVTPVRVPDIQALNTVGRVILLAEAAALLEPHLRERRNLIGDEVRALLDQGRLIPATDYVNAQRLRRAMVRDFQKLWKQVDCLFTPSTPITAPRIGETTVELNGEIEDVRLATTRFMRGINVLGLPALSIPCGQDRNRMPIGLQIVGKAFDEATVLRVGAALEDAA